MVHRPYMLSSPLRYLLFALTMGASLLAGAWFDIFPGGWRLRRWVTPHAHEARLAREQVEHSAQRMKGFGIEVSPPPGSTVWLGSSTIERFPLGQLLPGTSHVNRGIGGEPAAQLLERLEASLPASRPARLVFYIGSIDFRHLGRSPEQIAASAEEIVLTTLDTYPSSPAGSVVGRRPPEACLLGILPEQDMPRAMARRLERTNSLLASLCDSREGWTFIDTCRPPLQLADGSLNPDYAADRLHLNLRGYQVLASWMDEDL